MSGIIWPGMRIRDNDPRMGGRELRVIAVLTGFGKVAAHGTNPWSDRTTHIKISRIYIDGKPRKSGFSLIKGERNE